MPLRVICPNLRCRKLLACPEEARGKVVTCQFCRTPFRVPENMATQPVAAGATPKPEK